MDKQIELEKDLTEIFDEEYEKRNLITPKNTAEKLTAKGYQKQEWISVEERLPERYQTVLVHTIDGEIETDFLTIFGNFVIYEKKNITHWQPLPTPPKMKGAENE